jgi:Flp pilus assembly protein TadG
MRAPKGFKFTTIHESGAVMVEMAIALPVVILAVIAFWSIRTTFEQRAIIRSALIAAGGAAASVATPGSLACEGAITSGLKDYKLARGIEDTWTVTVLEEPLVSTAGLLSITVSSSSCKLCLPFISKLQATSSFLIENFDQAQGTQLFCRGSWPQTL